MFKVGDAVRNRVLSHDPRVEVEVGKVVAVEQEVLFGYTETISGRRFPVIEPAITVEFPGKLTYVRTKPCYFVHA